MTVDLHIDTPWMFTKHGPFDLAEGAPHSKVSLPKMKEGGLDVAVFALYLPDYVQDSLGPALSVRKLEEQLSNLRDAPFAVEGARLLSRDWQWFTELVGKGLKYITLVHNRNNIYADSAMDRPYHNGLSCLGHSLVKECEKHGVLVDISHSSDQTCEAVLEVTEQPVIASHSGCSSVTSHARNLTDSLIESIAKSGGVVGVPFARNFVGSDRCGIVDHIAHLVKIAGVEHVAIGSDLDGARMVDGIEDVSGWGSIVIDGLRERGFKREDVMAIGGGNAARLLNIANS